MTQTASHTDAGPRAALRAAIARHPGEPLRRVIAHPGIRGYRGYTELLEGIDRLAARGAGIEVVGRSVMGEPLFAIHLGAAGDPGARTSVVLSAVHPIEWIGVETHLALLERLVGADLGDRAVISIPIVNPDGLLRVEGNLRAGRRRFVRHNARGVDLNRNFEASWGIGGWLQRVLRFVFEPGAHPASEPEVAAVGHALAGRRVDRALSLHSFGGVVLYPPSGSLLPIADREEHRAWARRIGRAADPDRPYRAMSSVTFEGGQRQGGLEVDWFHDRHGALSLLVECSRLTLSPSRLLDPFTWFNPPRIAPVTMPLAEALSPFVKGLPV